jgi:GNAT superfamily N-acetyltransferase
MTQKSIPLIRPAGIDDAGLLAELGARTFSETFADDNSADNMSAYLANAFSHTQLAAELADPYSTFLIAEVDGIEVGYAKLHSGSVPEEITGEKPMELVRLYVSQAWLGRGIGVALMQSSIEEASRRGCRTLWLGVWERNGRARAFYRKCGFLEVGTHIFQLGDDPQTDILMERLI